MPRKTTSAGSMGSAPMNNLYRRALGAVCLVLGHRERVIACHERKHAALIHLHPFAGCLTICTRCHRIWDDYPGPIPLPLKPLPPARIKR